MPKKDENEDEDEDKDEYKDPFDIFKIFGDPNKFFRGIDPNKLFNSKEFQRIFKQIFKQIMSNLPEDLQGLSPEELMKEFIKNKSKFGFKGPIMYGFNISFDQAGNPVIDSFGNIKTEPVSGKPKVKRVREPLIEVNEEADQIIVIAEMPGVTKEDIELKGTNDSLTISTEKGTGRNYFKEIKLPAAVNSDYAKARYVNGILEIKLKKIDKKHTNIKID
ncbi:MAG: archaeal heat shock protein Hsp20 [Promethearchaeota archaeon]